MKRSKIQSGICNKGSKIRRVTFEYVRNQSLEETATPDGQLMFNALNQLNQNDQSRFEAYKRCTLPSDAISNFIASSLLHLNKDSARHRMNCIDLLGGVSNNIGNNESLLGELNASERDAATNHKYDEIRPSLAKLVAPGNAGKITSIVSTLAKINAQRLVQSARMIASSEGYDADKKLLPRHLAEAHRIKSKHGSGFFMQGNVLSSGGGGGSDGLSSGGGCGNSAADNDHIKFQAALKAQELYDSLIGDFKENEVQINADSIKEKETKDEDEEASKPISSD